VVIAVTDGMASLPLSGSVDANFQPQPHGDVADDPLRNYMPRPLGESKCCYLSSGGLMWRSAQRSAVVGPGSVGCCCARSDADV